MRTLAIHRRLLGAVLSEVVMATFISGLLFTVLPGFYFSYIKIWSRESSRIGGTERADVVMQRMAEEIRDARRVLISSDGSALTLVLPKQRYDSELGRPVNDFNLTTGQLTDGDRVFYYFVADASGNGRGLHRRVERADGTSLSPRLIASQIHPELNPLAASGTLPQPVFAYDSAFRTLTVTVTAAEVKPSAGSFAPAGSAVKCLRDGSALTRTRTTEHPEGELTCSYCGSIVRPNAELMTHQIQLGVRNQ